MAVGIAVAAAAVETVAVVAVAVITVAVAIAVTIAMAAAVVVDVTGQTRGGGNHHERAGAPSRFSILKNLFARESFGHALVDVPIHASSTNALNLT